MADIGPILRSALSIILGALLYAALNWLPIVGPLAVGAIVGYIVGGGFRRGFNHGIIASTLGMLALVYLFLSQTAFETANRSTILLMFLAWAMLVWNIVGVITTGIGGGLGALGKDLHAMIPKEIRDLVAPKRSTPTVDYVICPKCGQGNVNSALACSSCGKVLG